MAFLLLSIKYFKKTVSLLGVKGGSHDFKMIVSIDETWKWKTGMKKRANKRDEEYKDRRWRGALRSMNPFFVPRPDSGTN